jgi:tetratricopeptide (TPR) repeat protein/uncharacterized protein YegJ (DUF2314 family)
MVRLRCPECGYLQTLSEERFLSISEDFLSCPHCNAPVPKQWEPESEEAVPDDVRHKMHAFSRRILNGGNVAREVVHALESLVRRHGPADESNKALGIGYANLGEAKKAEAFLIEALQDEPHDAEVLHGLLEMLMSQKKHKEAVEVGKALVRVLGHETPDEDVAFLSLALTALDRKDEAQALLDAFTDLDPRNPMVKQAKKELTRGTAFGITGWFREKGPLHRLLRTDRNRDSVPPPSLIVHEESVSPTATKADASPSDNQEAPKASAVPTPPASAKKLDKLRATLEYWIYAPEPEIPGWEEVKSHLAGQHSRKAEQERVFKLLESLMERNDLAVDYILKNQAEELFNYPEELIPQNSRDFSEDDRSALLNAQMIVRLRLSLANYSGIDGLVFMVRFVEAVRGITGGMVQDAISHTLWGSDQWTACVKNPRQNLLEAHVQFEALDEGGVVWIHSHGMQKFGLPDLELEGVPSEFATIGRYLVVLVGETLIGARDIGLDFGSPFTISNRHIAFTVTVHPRDEEGHFRAGSLKIHPYVSGSKPDHPDALKEVLVSLQSTGNASHVEGRKSGPPEMDERTNKESETVKQALRDRLLTAHKMARKDLPMFKKSFQQTHRSGANVHAVKVGFPAQGGEYEWMWVSLDAWRGKSMVGHVENTPVLRRDLRKGSRVQLSEGQIFDWVIASGEKILKGPYTEEVLN